MTPWSVESGAGMNSGRRTALAGAALALATGAVVTVVLTADEPRPVDVRRVDLAPVEPEVLSATYTTTVEVQRSTTPVVVLAPPVQRPAPPPASTSTTTPPPPPPPSSFPPSPSSSPTRLPDHCDPSYVTDGVCVPKRFPPHVWRYCEWLRAQGVTDIRVVGRDHHRLDRDRDGQACEPRT